MCIRLIILFWFPCFVLVYVFMCWCTRLWETMSRWRMIPTDFIAPAVNDPIMCAWRFPLMAYKPVGVRTIPASEVHGTNMGPIWGRQEPGGPHVGPMNLAIWNGNMLVLGIYSPPYDVALMWRCMSIIASQSIGRLFNSSLRLTTKKSPKSSNHCYPPVTGVIFPAKRPVMLKLFAWRGTFICIAGRL